MSIFTANSSSLRSLFLPLHHCATFTPSLFMYKHSHFQDDVKLHDWGCHTANKPCALNSSISPI
jgi:hypothetical protein